MLEPIKPTVIEKDVGRVRNLINLLMVPKGHGVWMSPIGELLFSQLPHSAFHYWGYKVSRQFVGDAPPPLSRSNAPSEHTDSILFRDVCWHVELTPGTMGGHPTGWACVAAFEEDNDSTLLQFYDGYDARLAIFVEPIGPAFEGFAEMIIREVSQADTKIGVRREGGPTEDVRTRAKVFKRLKDEHPEWTQQRVAMEAQRELQETITADTVRNAYRAMGWKWKRGARTR